jgi:15-hydroxyprostaglandin dehydrogenase (NAD)
VSIADLNEKTGEAAAKHVNGLFTKTDVTSYSSQANAFSKTWEKYGHIDFGLKPFLQCRAQDSKLIIISIL